MFSYLKNILGLDSPISRAELSVALDASTITTNDPFFEVYQSVQSEILSRAIDNSWQVDLSNTKLPLRHSLTEGPCIMATRYATLALQRVYGVKEIDISIHSFSNRFPEDLSITENENCGFHQCLYVNNASQYVTAEDSFDVFFDATSSQFSGYDRDGNRIPKDFSLYHILSAHGKKGLDCAKGLFAKGYVILPHDDKGDELANILIHSYARAIRFPLAKLSNYDRDTLQKSSCPLGDISRFEEKLAQGLWTLPTKDNVRNPVHTVQTSQTRKLAF